MKRYCGMAVLMIITLATFTVAHPQDELLIFAVVSEVPKDKSRVAVKASVNDVATDTKLLASDAVLNNLIWKKLEICHAMRVEGTKTSDGYKVLTVKIIDASMLPMSLQSFAGDCLIKKAIVVAPLVDSHESRIPRSSRGSQDRPSARHPMHTHLTSVERVAGIEGRDGSRNRRFHPDRCLSEGAARTGRTRLPLRRQT